MGDLGVGVRVILKWTLKKSVEGEWIKLAQDWDP